MQKDSPIFDDFARFASGAAGTFSDMRREMEALVMDKIQKVLSRMHLVKREEFDVVKLMAEKARAEQERLSLKVAALEKLLQKGGCSE